MNTPANLGKYGPDFVFFADIGFGHLRYEGDMKPRYTVDRRNLPWSDDEKQEIAEMLFKRGMRSCKVILEIAKKDHRSKVAAYTMVFRIKKGIVQVPGYEAYQ